VELAAVKEKRPLRARGRRRNEAQRRGPSGGTKARSWAWWRPCSSVAAKRRHGSTVVGAVVSAPRRSVVSGTVCGDGTVGVTQVDKDGPGPVPAAGRPEVASRQLLSACYGGSEMRMCHTGQRWHVPPKRGWAQGLCPHAHRPCLS